ncbi:MAG: hypothetical protein H0U76_27800 [Ktedonobacteraceae bacterium]|nr:hypothetical protein [Ktedonobacteraceae bacterium]
MTQQNAETFPDVPASIQQNTKTEAFSRAPASAQQNAETETFPGVPTTAHQSAKQESQTTLQHVPDPESNAVQPASEAHYPIWPTSKPGPRATQPPPGMLPTHIFRTEQMTEIAYNQETGEPVDDSPERTLPNEAEKGSVSFDLKPKTGQETLGKRKQRL